VAKLSEAQTDLLGFKKKRRNRKGLLQRIEGDVERCPKKII